MSKLLQLFGSNKLFKKLFVEGSRRINILISIAFSLSTFWWTHPDNTLLYGQDSFNFFLNAFNPIFNPLHVYNIEQGWITHISINSGYPTFALSFFLELFLSIPLTERVILALFIFIQTFGFLRLLETFDKFRPSKRKNNIALLVASLFYLANVFTLTVTLWHYEIWTFPLVVAPYWLSSIIEILYSNKVSRNRLLQTIGLSIILSPAMSGGWSIMWILLIFIAFIFLILFSILGKYTIREVLSRFWYLIALAGSTLLWVNIPNYLIFFIIHPVAFTSINTYQSAFLATKTSYPIYRVIAGLNLSPWTSFDISSYGWPNGYWNILLYSSYLIIPIFFLGLFFLKRNRVLIFLYTISIPVIIFSNGDSFPFGYINNYLYHFGGVFLILVNAYYFIGALYLLSIGVILYILFEWALENMKRLTSKKTFSMYMVSDECTKIHNVIKRKIRSKKVESIFIIAAILLLISVPLYPLVSSTQYSTKDNVANMIYMPPTLNEASSYLYSKATNTSGYLLILPMSDSSSYHMEFNNSQLTDTSSLFSYLSPIPIIDANRSYYDSQLFNFLWEMNYSNLVPVLQMMHISYVLFNPYFTTYDSGFYPSGRESNISIFLEFVYNKLNEEIGSPAKFGSVSVFTIPNIVPLAYAVKDLSFARSESLDDYFNFVSSLRSSVNISTIESLIWTNSSGLPSSCSYIQPKSFNGFSFTTKTSGLDQIDMVGNGGSIKEVWNKTHNISSNILNVINSSVISIKSKDINHFDKLWNNNIDQYSEHRIFNFSSEYTNRSILNFNISNLKLDNKTWNYFGITVNLGNYSIEISFDANVSQSSYFYNLQAFYRGDQYEWDYIHGSNYSYYFSGNDHITIYLQSGSFYYTMTSSTNKVSYNSPRFFFNPSSFFKDQGYNSSLISKIYEEKMSTNLSLTMFFDSIHASLVNASALISLPYSYVILIHGNPLKRTTIPSTFKYDNEGNIIIRLKRDFTINKYFIIFALKNEGCWQILSKNTGSQRLDVSKFSTIFAIPNTNLSVVEIGINRNVTLLIYACLVAPLNELSIIFVYYIYKKRKSFL